MCTFTAPRPPKHKLWGSRSLHAPPAPGAPVRTPAIKPIPGTFCVPPQRAERGRINALESFPCTLRRPPRRPLRPGLPGGRIVTHSSPCNSDVQLSRRVPGDRPSKRGVFFL